jgi:hypothetical protein
MRLVPSTAASGLSTIFTASLNLAASAVTHHKAFCGQEEHMKIALLALLGLALGALGGAALGIGTGLASPGNTRMNMTERARARVHAPSP